MNVGSSTALAMQSLSRPIWVKDMLRRTGKKRILVRKKLEPKWLRIVMLVLYVDYNPFALINIDLL